LRHKLHALPWATAKAVLQEEQSKRAEGYVFRALATHPECVKDFDSLPDDVVRCPQLMYKSAIQRFFGANATDLAEETWREAVSHLDEAGEPHVRWPSVLETPTIWLRELRSSAFWDCEPHFPWVSALQDLAPSVAQEAHGVAGMLGAAYKYLRPDGAWDVLNLYRGGEWQGEACEAMPTTCAFLQANVPTARDSWVVPNNEEVVLLRSSADTFVPEHSGAVNNQINIHFTISGAGSAVLTVGGKGKELQDGKALCFQDSFSHSLNHTHEGDRYTLVVRVLHPDVKTRAGPEA